MAPMAGGVDILYLCVAYLCAEAGAETFDAGASDGELYGEADGIPACSCADCGCVRGCVQGLEVGDGCCEIEWCVMGVFGCERGYQRW